VAPAGVELRSRAENTACGIPYTLPADVLCFFCA
jgi:hypothetical protein